MPICSICKSRFFYQSEIEPCDPCDCGECATGSLWQWNKYRAYIKWLKWKLYSWKYSRYSPICFYLNYKSLRNDINFFTGEPDPATRLQAFREAFKIVIGKY